MDYRSILILGIVLFINVNWSFRDYSYTVKNCESIQDGNCIFHIAWYRSSTVSGFDRGDICNSAGISAFGVESRFIHERKIER